MNFQSFYDKVYNWMLTMGPKLILSVILLVIGLWLIRIFQKWMRAFLTRRRFDNSLKPFLLSLITVALQVLLVFSIMQILGIQMTIFAAVLGAIGVAAGFALSGTLQNFTSGVIILFLKPYRVGDNIIAQGQDGIVSSIQLFYTVIITFDNKTVIIPNSKLSNEVIINISRQGRRRLDMELKFNFSFDFEKIKDIVLQTLRSSDVVLEDPAPSLGVSVIEPDGFKIMIHAWVSAKRFEENKFIIQQKVIKELIRNGVKLPGM